MANDGLDELAFLARSKTRMAVLESLSDQPRDLRDLSDDLGVPRTTLSDNLVQIEERGWIERTEGAYRLTTLGRTVNRVVSACRRSIGTANDLSPFLESVPEPEHDIDVSRLHGSSVVTAEFPRPYAPVERFRDVVEDASTFRGLMPIVLPNLGEFFRRQFVDAGLEVEILLDERTFDVFVEQFDGLAELACPAGQVQLCIYEGDVDFGLVLLDETVVLVSMYDNGLVDTVVTNDSPAAYEWGESVYESYRSEVERCFP